MLIMMSWMKLMMSERLISDDELDEVFEVGQADE